GHVGSRERRVVSVSSARACPPRGVSFYVRASVKSTTISRLRFRGRREPGSSRISLTTPRGRATKTPVFFRRLDQIPRRLGPQVPSVPARGRRRRFPREAPVAGSP